MAQVVRSQVRAEFRARVAARTLGIAGDVSKRRVDECDVADARSGTESPFAPIEQFVDVRVGTDREAKFGQATLLAR